MCVLNIFYPELDLCVLLENTCVFHVWYFLAPPLGIIIKANNKIKEIERDRMY